MSKTQITVQSTTDYKKFLLLANNRPIAEAHVKRLMKSMSEHVAMSPIQVNEKYEIIDGQHRFTALSRLGKPIYYYVVPGASTKDVQSLNTHTRPWDHIDYIESYIKSGNKNYELYKKFRETYGLGTTTNLYLLTGNGNIKEDQDNFSRGKLEVVDYDKAVDIAEKIVKMGTYVTFYKDRSFCYAMMRAIRNPKFDFNKFYNEKLVYQSRKIVKCANVEQYLEIIQEIYNYKAKKTERIQLTKL
jgi:hypothetical protein